MSETQIRLVEKAFEMWSHGLVHINFAVYVPDLLATIRNLQKQVSEFQNATPGPDQTTEDLHVHLRGPARNEDVGGMDGL